MIQKIYILENLGCANCAAKMEAKILALPEVSKASIVYTTKQLRVTAENPDALLPILQKIVSEIESEVVIVPRNRNNNLSHQTSHTCNYNHSQEHHHDTCNCGHSHEHDHDTCNCGHSHEHHHDTCDCGHSHEHHHDKHDYNHIYKYCRNLFFMLKENPLVMIPTGAIFFSIGIILKKTMPDLQPFFINAIFMLSYLILGFGILKEAFNGVLNKNIFNENLLMAVATIGAIIIGDFAEAVGVMLFFRIGEYFEELAVDKSRKQIMDAVDMRPETVTRFLLDSKEIEIIPASDASPNDLLLVRAGDRIPLDGTVIEGESYVDTSPITGEPVPVKVEPGSTIISGCMNTNGSLTIKVEKNLEQSMVTRILDSVENAAANKPQLDRFITRFSRIYTPFIMALALFTALIPPLLFHESFSKWIYTALTFLVISCPCALVLSVPLSFFSGIGAGSKKGILFKGGASLEALAAIHAVAMDKTGTITKGNFVLQQIKINDLKNLSSLLPSSQTNFSLNDAENLLLGIAASCEQISSHPIAQSLVAAAKERNLILEIPNHVKEFSGKGILADTSYGAILLGNKSFMSEQQLSIPYHTDTASGTEVLLACNNVFLGYFIIADTLKADAASSIAELKKNGITTAMLTGDSEKSAKEIADLTGIEKIYAKLLPDDKVSCLAKIRKTYGSVMFVGDGINDAPVLAGADVGAAMGSGADAAIEAADVVFMTSNMEAIPQAYRIAKTTTKIAKQNIIFACSIKALIMLLGLLGISSMWMAVFADSGVALLCVLNSIRILYQK